jgi:hypothetical protein
VACSPDLTTDKAKFKALIHSAPTAADLEGDGRSEVIVGTSLGLLYVLDGTYSCTATPVLKGGDSGVVCRR